MSGHFSLTTTHSKDQGWNEFHSHMNHCVQALSKLTRSIQSPAKWIVDLKKIGYSSLAEQSHHQYSLCCGCYHHKGTQAFLCDMNPTHTSHCIIHQGRKPQIVHRCCPKSGKHLFVLAQLLRRPASVKLIDELESGKCVLLTLVNTFQHSPRVASYHFNPFPHPHQASSWHNTLKVWIGGTFYHKFHAYSRQKSSLWWRWYYRDDGSDAFACHICPKYPCFSKAL